MRGLDSGNSGDMAQMALPTQHTSHHQKHTKQLIKLFYVLCCCCFCCCFCNQTPFKGWGHGEDYGAPEAGQLPRAWTRGRRKTKSRQIASGSKKQNEMRGVLGPVSAGAAGRILDSANPRVIRA